MSIMVIVSLMLTNSDLVSQVTTFGANSAIVNMGVVPQTYNNGLKPYTLVKVLTQHFIPVYWAIDPNKKLGGKDFSAQGTDYKGGCFIIPVEFINANTTSILNFWAGEGVVIDYPTVSFSAPIYDIITSFPNSVLDTDNGNLAKNAFFTRAMMPDSVFIIGGSGDLTSCDDIYIMPHADPHDCGRSHFFTKMITVVVPSEIAMITVSGLDLEVDSTKCSIAFKYGGIVRIN